MCERNNALMKEETYDNALKKRGNLRQCAEKRGKPGQKRSRDRL
jgi:hypothetical protein